MSNFPDYDTPEGLAKLAEFFEPYYSRIGGYQEGDINCRPEKILTTKWMKDPWAGNGSYSNFQTGLEDGERDIEEFRKGLPERGVWFAGEHTAPVLGLGSVSGAYWSGENAAEKVVESFGGGVGQVEEGENVEVEIKSAAVEVMA